VYVFTTETDHHTLAVRERDSHREFEPGVGFPADDDEQYATYRRQNDKIRQQLGVTFGAASRVYAGGFTLDCAPPANNRDHWYLNTLQGGAFRGLDS
jgi:hypothetical protein